MTIQKLIEAKIVDIEKKIHPMIGNATWRPIEIKEILNQQISQALTDIALASVEAVKVEKKTEGILGILGTEHRDGVINEGYNQAIDQLETVKSQLKREIGGQDETERI